MFFKYKWIFLSLILHPSLLYAHATMFTPDITHKMMTLPLDKIFKRVELLRFAGVDSKIMKTDYNKGKTR